MRQSRGNQRIDRNRSTTGWKRHLSNRWVIPAGILVFALPTLVVVARTDGSSASRSLWQVVLLLALIALLVAVVLGFGLQLAGFDGEAEDIAHGLTTDQDQARLLERWLTRARWARLVGGFSGVITWMLATDGRGDLLLLGTAGIAVGAMLAELHHVRRRPGPRTARLDVRRVDDYLLASDRNRMIGVAIAAVAVGILALALRPVAAWWALAALVVLGLARLMQQRVAGRPRPAVAPKLLRADDLARELAIGRGLARPTTVFALTLIARAGYMMMANHHDIGRTIGIVAWLYALYLWWHNRRLGLDFVIDEPRGAALT